ncbi:hypothetical protein ACVMGC_001040 [Bradyrhizobium barranii subsp. barranii]|uniref:hypothetical protein n=1 Tax=Bradyrhizobium TaxID=374 RepID=UPI001BAA5EA2|nr:MULTISPECIES: hypothetical protein [Bradyrhizobium]MBR0879639.1 hypothetical protein [Bradyrhizobium liaoningense]MCP1778807.1 hypothetical protein [Bradyrhizobium japonicum]MCP1958195.1 hypothetical protein [Bradyrhizobium japonicum]
MIAEILFQLVLVHGPDNHPIHVNPDEVVSVRKAPPDQGYLQKGIKCLIHTTDGKYITATEDCDKIRELIEAAKNQR